MIRKNRGFFCGLFFLTCHSSLRENDKSNGMKCWNDKFTYIYSIQNHQPMKPTHYISLIAICLLTAISCKQNKESQEPFAESRTQIELTTTKGDIVLELYNETPKHRDNFIKLAKDKTLNGLLFHRVIQNFMIQGGDIESRDAQPQDTLGNGELPYLVDAEFHPDLFHKKGALGAARDGNLARASSSTQFYIVQGQVQDDEMLEFNEGRINGWLQEHAFRNDPKHKALLDDSNDALKKENQDLFITLQDSIVALMRDYPYEKYAIPQDHRDVYKTIGGAPHLDRNYTVFGEVISGLNIIDSIALVKTNDLDRPLEDVRLISVKVKN